MAITRSRSKPQAAGASQPEASSSTNQQEGSTTIQPEASGSSAQASTVPRASASTSRAKQVKRKVSKPKVVSDSQAKKTKNPAVKKTAKRSKKEDNPGEPPKKKRMSKKAQREEALSHFPAQHRKLQERLFRVQTQKMLVVQRTVVNSQRQTFDVLGSTGNKYTVDIGPKLKCECRDFLFRRTHCKHILMVLTKVFHVNATSAACQKMSLTGTELEDVFATCTPDASVIASEQVQRQLEHKLYGKPLPQDDTEGPKRRPLDTSDCPVCFEEFTEAELPVILFCKSCGNNIHKACFEAWSSQGRSKVTCVYCRAEWADEGSSSKKVDLRHLRNEEGYVNLADIAGLSSKRDTSTYGL